MISPEEFVRCWEIEGWMPTDDLVWNRFRKKTLIRFPKRLIESLTIPNEDKEFLCKAGLPEAAEPSLYFDVQKGDSWSILGGELPSEDYRRIYVIGCGGCGDPIAIDGTAGGQN